jgi:hypothetical protein
MNENATKRLPKGWRRWPEQHPRLAERRVKPRRFTEWFKDEYGNLTRISLGVRDDNTPAISDAMLHMR